MVVPPLYTFSAEYAGDSPAYDELDEYLRVELAKGGDDLSPKFGKQAQFVPDLNRFDYTYTLTGNVPASSREEAERKVRELLSRIDKGLKSLRREVALRDPIVRVWKHEHQETEKPTSDPH